ncbi:MAG: M23 family metallopeptidase [Pseudomonadota bacterium]
MTKAKSSPLVTKHRTGCPATRGLLRWVFSVGLAAGAVLAAGTAPTNATGNSLANRIIVPVLAPPHLRHTETVVLEDLAGKLATGRSLSRTELSHWLKNDGHKLGQLLAKTGLDAARLIEGALDDQGVGGPFIALGSDARTADATGMTVLIDRVAATVPLAPPVRAKHRLTSGFGPRRDPLRGVRAFHRGIDLAAPKGTPIHATADGTVIKVGRRGAYGNRIELDHGNGVRTLYAHLHQYHVRRGEQVEVGEVIGLMGRTGRTTGNHLHYEVIVDDRPLNPRRFLRVGQELAAVRP